LLTESVQTHYAHSRLNDSGVEEGFENQHNVWNLFIANRNPARYHCHTFPSCDWED